MSKQLGCPAPQCERDNCFNARREELQRNNTAARNCCPAKNAAGCAVDACDKTVCYREDFFARPAGKCENPTLTGYGKQHVANTGKMITKCACVKFNGLQDTCKHPSCNNNPQCLDHPFPNCPPARKWKCDYMCKNDRVETKKNPCD